MVRDRPKVRITSLAWMCSSASSQISPYTFSSYHRGRKAQTDAHREAKLSCLAGPWLRTYLGPQPADRVHHRRHEPRHLHVQLVVILAVSHWLCQGVPRLQRHMPGARESRPTHTPGQRSTLSVHSHLAGALPPLLKLGAMLVSNDEAYSSYNVADHQLQRLRCNQSLSWRSVQAHEG